MEETFLLADIEKAPAGSHVRDFLKFSRLSNTLRYHKSFPSYRKTPLADLAGLAGEIGAARIFVKDESYRFGLNAFKVLGGSYAMGMYLAEKLGIPETQVTYESLSSPEARAALGVITFVTATDGNHGRGVAWTARELGHRSVVYMPHGSAAERLENIRAEGADASITDMNYDEAVRLANRMAGEKGWVMVQDTAWEGYEEIPRRIMQGYATMALEAAEEMGDEIPTHVFLQAGVGSLAGAVSGFLADYYGDRKPVITIVEPNKADCIYRTAAARDGQLHFVTGEMDTIMAGLACGEPNRIAWDVLRETAEFALSCPDYVSAKGMRILGNPIGQDRRVISGESGAVTLGLAASLMTREDLKDIRDRIGLNRTSKILCFSTEGDTDRKNYRRIVWDGLYPSL
jgi:diaminopropionate ammonia-lyase